MKICVIGLWHLGLVTTASLAKLGNKVTSIDDEDLINRLKNFDLPIQEKNLLRYLKKYKKNINFRPIKKNFPKNKVFWITYDTKIKQKDNVNMKETLNSLKKIFLKIPYNSIVIISSQIPVGTIKKIEKINLLNNKKKLTFFYIPENLRLGNSIQNFLQPDRMVIGTNTKDTKKINVVKMIFKKFNCKIYLVSSDTAEMTKHVINSFLACSISFINEISEISSKFNINLNELEETVKSDNRIGFKSYLRAGFSFSGGTLARDVNILNNQADKSKIKLQILNNIIKSNNKRKQSIISSILNLVKGKKNILQVGLTYKAGTNTLRRSFPNEIYKKISINKSNKIEMLDSDLDSNIKKINILDNNIKKKFDVIIIFKKEKNLFEIINKYSNINTRIIDIGRYAFKLKKKLNYFY